MENSLLQLLRQRGPSLSSRLVDDLAAGGVSREAARQRISRSGEPVRRLTRLGFARNERFVFLAEQSETEPFYRAFLDACDATNSAYGPVLHVLGARGGICLESHFDVLAGCPTARRGQISLARLKEDLVSVGAVEPALLNGKNAVQVTEKLFFPNPSLVRARLVAEGVLLVHVAEWLRRLGMVSWDAFKVRNESELPNFAGFPFDIVGPSYLRALVTHRPDRLLPGFVAADVHIGFEMHQQAMAYFVRKLQIARSGKNRPAIGILVADTFSPDALKLGRREGFIVATPEILFGKDVADALRDLVSTLTNIAVAATRDPEVVTNLFERLGRIEGAAANLRGPLFELIVAHLVATEGGSIFVGRRAFSSGRSAEIDVLRVRAHDVSAYECRGHGPGHEVGISSVTKWVSEKVPVMREWLVSSDEIGSRPHVFHYWTTGCFSQEAVTFLRAFQERTKKFRIEWKDGSDVLAVARGSASKRIVETLNEHYLRHPIATSTVTRGPPL